MRYFPKRFLGFSLALLMTAATVSGCTAPQEAKPTLTAPAVPQEPTISLDKEAPVLPVIKPTEGNTDKVTQIRLYNAQPGWLNAFETDHGAFFVADSVESLLDGLTHRGLDTSKLDLSAFDGAFFANNRLVVIPRRTNSGSVRFSARIDCTDDGVKITPVGTMPEVGTADMADWLVLVALSNDEYAGTVTVENVKNVVGNAQRYATHRY
jgi:hypothetical protein